MSLLGIVIQVNLALGLALLNYEFSTSYPNGSLVATVVLAGGVSWLNYRREKRSIRRRILAERFRRHLVN